MIHTNDGTPSTVEMCIVWAVVVVMVIVMTSAAVGAI